VKDSRAFILPSWTDISPNQVYEALAIGLPTLVTKENYLSIADRLPATIDPHSVEDIARKLEMLADDAAYRDFSEKFRAIRFEHDWDDVVRQHKELFEKIIEKKP
jgi:glycosyltransferase involved in cell wall biosynthesis